MKRFDSLAAPLDGVLLIEASAGTGKTYTVETLYLRLLLERELGADEILVVTYTNAAAAELRERIRTRLSLAQHACESELSQDGEEWLELLRRRRAQGVGLGDRARLLSAVYDLDQAPILTIHSFCQRVLQDQAFRSGAPYGAELISDQTAMLDELVRDFWVRELHDAPRELLRELRGGLPGLLALARAAVGQPDLAFVPAPRRLGDLGALIEAWGDARLRAEALLAPDVDAIVDMLCRSKAVTTAVHRVEPWTRQLADELRADEAFVGSRFKYLERYSSRQNEKLPFHPFFDACADLVDREGELGSELASQSLALRHRLVEFARRELRERKRDANVFYFDDLLQRVSEALGADRGAYLAQELRRQYPVALIDEFQDTDPVQCEIFERIYAGQEGAGLFLVGDPKQAIYAFRGADVYAYTRAKTELPGEQCSLGINRRSTGSLVEAVNAVFERAKRGGAADFIIPGIDFEPVAPCPQPPAALHSPSWGPLRFLFCRSHASGSIGIAEGRKQVNRGIVGEIVRLLNAKPRIDDRTLRAADVAVLCRTNDEARTLQAELRRAGVPTALQGDSSVFESAEAEEMLRVMRAMAEPRDAAAVRAALATSIFGRDALALYEMREGEARDGDTADAEEPATDWRGKFREWHELWERHGFMPAFRDMLGQSGAPAALLALADGERRLTNILHLSEILQTAGREQRRGPLGLVEWLALMRDDASRRAEAGEAAQIRLERDAHALVLTTIHRSKGLQYPIVFCPFLWHRRLPKAGELHAFHDPSHDDRRSMDFEASSDSPNMARMVEEDLAENMRLLYVALTRAERGCAVVWGRFKECERSALGYVLHQPESAAGSVAAATAERIASMSEADMLADLQELSSAVPGGVEVETLSLDLPPPYHDEDPIDAAGLHPRTRRRHSVEPWRVSSFSALVAAPHDLTDTAQEGLDRDELAADEVGEESPVEGGAARRIRLAELPAGPRTGLMIHKILELVDFGDSGGAEQRRIAENVVAAYGFERRWADVVYAAVCDMAETSLPAGADTLRLGDVERERRIDEMEFVFPIGDAKGRLLTPASLADAFSRHAAPSPDPAYADQLRGLGFDEFSGFLRGYIDLVFQHGGRWYLADYKSNFLGADGADYRIDRLCRQMASSHYYLQYHLYTVALHRYLVGRLSGYDYESHFGGVFYLFIRGISASNPHPWGIFYDRPSAALIDDLSASLSTVGRAEVRQ